MFVCTHLGVGVRRLGKVAHHIRMGAGARQPAHLLLILAHAHGVNVVQILGEANTVSRRGVSAYEATQRVGGQALFQYMKSARASI